MFVPKSIAVPLILSVWVMVALVAGYSCVMLPGFLRYCEHYSSSGAIQLATITSAFARFHWAGVPLMLLILGLGVQLFRKPELHASHLAWYVSVSISVAAAWQTWAMLAERSLQVLLLPA